MHNYLESSISSPINHKLLNVSVYQGINIKDSINYEATSNNYNDQKFSSEDQKSIEHLRREETKNACNKYNYNAYSAWDFNLLRWTLAYAGDLDTATRKFKRHLRIRQILRLDAVNEWTEMADGIDEFADVYAPISICGEIGMSNGFDTEVDNRILLIEKSGKFDLPKIMETIRTSAFMMNRFRVMERILRAIQISEECTARLSSAVLIIDLQGLVFHSGLIGFISGSYRIMWGTLIEQYPHLISQIFVINTPTFMNVLWNVCCTFIPTEYREKIHLCGENWRDTFKKYISIDCLPVEYGGCRNMVVEEPNFPCFDLRPTIFNIDDTFLDVINISAGGVVVHTFYFKEFELLEFYIKHNHALTMNIFFTPTQKKINNINKDVEQMEEVFAGCERPGGLPQLDFWKWHVPYTGFYHTIFGNEKAWIMSVSIKYQIFQIHPNNGSRIKVNRIPT